MTMKTMADYGTFDNSEVGALASLIPAPANPADQQALWDALARVDGLRDGYVTETRFDEAVTAAYTDAAEATRDTFADKAEGAYWRAEVCQLPAPSRDDVLRMIDAVKDGIEDAAREYVSTLPY